MKTTKEMIAVMEHYDNGGEVEVEKEFQKEKDWILDNNPSWDWACYDYRIKPKEKKKVKLYKWAVKIDNVWHDTATYHIDAKECNEGKWGKDYIRLDYTMIEVEEDEG